MTVIRSDLMRGRPCCQSHVWPSSLLSWTLCSWDTGIRRGIAEHMGWLASIDESSCLPSCLVLPLTGVYQYKAQRSSCTESSLAGPSTCLFPQFFFFQFLILFPVPYRSLIHSPSHFGCLPWSQQISLTVTFITPYKWTN